MPRGVKKTSVRIDPAPRPIDGGIPYFNVVNKNPARRYVWVYKAAQEYGVEHYQYLGYRIERYQENSPRPAMVPIDVETGEPAKENGSTIESRGNVLMSIDVERYNDIYQNGEDGISGQKAADAMERRLLDRTKIERDSMRGINPRNSDGSRTFGVEFDRGSIASVPTGDADG